MLADARRGHFDVLGGPAIAWPKRASLPGSADELNRLNIEYIASGELDTASAGPRRCRNRLCIAELERSLIVERVRAGCDALGLKAGTSPPTARINHDAVLRSASMPEHQSDRPNLLHLQATVSRILNCQTACPKGRCKPNRKYKKTGIRLR